MYLPRHILQHIIGTCDDIDVRRDFKIFKHVVHSFTFVPQPCLPDDTDFYTWLLTKRLQYVKVSDTSYVREPFNEYYFYDTYGYYDGTKNTMKRGPY